VKRPWILENHTFNALNMAFKRVNCGGTKGKIVVAHGSLPCLAQLIGQNGIKFRFYGT